MSAGWLAAEHGDLDTGASAARQAVRLAEALGGRFTANAQTLLGYIALQQGHYDAASKMFARSLRTFQANGDLAGVGQVRHHQAHVALKTGDPARAEALFGEVITIARQTQDTSLATYALLSIIPILVDDGRATEARHCWMTAYQQADPADSATLRLALLGYAAAIAAAAERARRAVVLTEVALGLLSATGWQDDALLAWFWKTVAPAYEALDEATLTAAREQARQLPPDAALLYAASDDDRAAALMADEPA